ncbi:MAG: pyridoxal phosphate-dependent aminotransferase [Bacteroidales bacterium]|nr:pyridoxal phosphate-dependent aminotransferase [Bacteroidales bacterium]
MIPRHYNFNTVTDRHGSNSVKWDFNPDPEVIPMWVADMDFQTAPFILDAVRRRVEHGIFGYTHVPESYYRSVQDWFLRRRGWTIRREWIRPLGGLVPALSVAVLALTEPGDRIVFNNPAYNCFFSCVERNGRTVSASPLREVERGGRLHFLMDFEDLERRLSDPKASLFVLCNPHNPTGRIWTEEELRRVGELCLKHGVTVISDEIHCELEMPGQRYLPFASLSPDFEAACVTLCSPSKAFNIAGLEISNVITASKILRTRIGRVIAATEHGGLNPIGVAALQAAYSPEGEAWLEQLNGYLHGNFLTLESRLAEAGLQAFRLSDLEGTYLAWMDCRSLTGRGIDSDRIQRELTEVEKVWINGGRMYGDGDFMRINFACPRTTLAEGVQRIVRGLRRLSELS